MRKNQDTSHIMTISPWFTIVEAAAYYKMSMTSFRKIAPQIGGRIPECFNKEMRFHKDDLDNWMLRHPKIA